MTCNLTIIEGVLRRADDLIVFVALARNEHGISRVRKRERWHLSRAYDRLDAEALAAFLHANNDVLDDRIGRFGAGDYQT